MNQESIEGYELFKNIKTKLLNLKQMLFKEENRETVIQRAFGKLLVSEFKGKISKNNRDNSSKIKIFEGENEILNILIDQNKIKRFSIFDELYFLDATFIESPIVLQLSEAIDKSETYFEETDSRNKVGRVNIPLHIKDLHNKLQISFYEEQPLLSFDDTGLENLLDKLSKIIGGKIKYLKKEKDFVYIADNGNKFNSLNTATGIKSFGIIQMLIKSGFINQRSLLILDEPEVHLHPKWQIRYAELVIELVKNDINVLVTSHSPYMIEALQRYSELAEVNSDFYLAKEEKIDKIDDSNSDTLAKIFEKLSEPFDVFEEMDMERLLDV